MSRIFPIFSVLLAVGLYFAYIGPTYNTQIVEAQKNINTDNQALTAAAAFTAKENQLTAEVNQIPPTSISRLEEFLPDGVDNIQLLLDLNSLAARTGISLSNFSISDNTTSSQGAGSSDSGTVTSGAPSDQVQSLNLSVTATGTYAAFKTFLMAAEQSLRPLDVVNLSVQSAPNGVYTYNVTFQIYWLQ